MHAGKQRQKKKKYIKYETKLIKKKKMLIYPFNGHTSKHTGSPTN